MPSIRIDWQRVREMSDSPDGLSLFVLPTAYRTMLLHMSQVLEWEATFRTNNYDYGDWDFLQSIVAQGESGLMANETLEDVIDAINNINVTATAESNSSAVANGGGGCCGTDKKWRLPEGWETEHPTVPQDESEDVTAVSQATLCDMAHASHAEIAVWFQQFSENVGSASPYQDLVEEIDEFGLSNPYSSWLYTAMSLVVALLYDELLSEVGLHWETMKDEYICKVLELDNAAAVKSWVLSRIWIGAPTWSASFYMETLLTGTSWNTVYDGSYVIPVEYVGSDCSGCLPPSQDGYYRATNISNQEVIAGYFTNGVEFVLPTPAAAGSGGGFLWLVQFFTDDTLGTGIDVNVEISSYNGWVAPTNANHPFSVQTKPIVGGWVTQWPLGTVPNVGYSSGNWNQYQMHSLTDFSVGLTIT